MLDETPIQLWASFTNYDQSNARLPARLSLEWNAFEESSDRKSWNNFSVEGSVAIKNTIESFKEVDKGAFIKSQGESIWETISSGDWLVRPNDLVRFSILMYADLKKFHYYYWFAFPSFALPGEIQAELIDIKSEFSSDLFPSFSDLMQQDNSGEIFQILQTSGNNFLVRDLKYLKEVESNSSVYLCVKDPSTHSKHSGWPLRNLVAAIAHQFPRLLEGLKVVCVRSSKSESGVTFENSLLLKLGLKSPNSLPLSSLPGVVGWEKTEKGQLGPRLANMRDSMDPGMMAENSLNLNLKLMKWRLVPDLDLEKIMSSKCLLLGAGTLGCAVARNLLGWGVKHITFVDNGKVSYSNPARQSLFTFKDCESGGKHKAKAAAARLREIMPGVVSEGHVLSIPMPGHQVSSSNEAEVAAAYSSLCSLIASHSLVFLLLDSREARWLPTVLCAASQEDKLVINAALGFNSYLVMRHGVRNGECCGSPLGCYFCNDVVAPADSLADRSLDQQCTVTRAGVSGVAASLATELAVATLSHPLGVRAPPGGEGVLGSVPHTIRGWVSDFSQMTPTGQAFSQCTACSPPVLERIKEDGFEFVKKVGESPQYLEDITGLTSLKQDSSLLEDVIDLDDDESVSMSSES